MTIDNGENCCIQADWVHLDLVYVLYVFMAYFPKIFRHIMSEDNVNIMTAVLNMLVICCLLFWPAIMKFRYIYFSADERVITLRWYKTGLMPGESKSIEIPADRFAGYEITPA